MLWDFIFWTRFPQPQRTETQVQPQEGRRESRVMPGAEVECPGALGTWTGGSWPHQAEQTHRQDLPPLASVPPSSPSSVYCQVRRRVEKRRCFSRDQKAARYPHLHPMPLMATCREKSVLGHLQHCWTWMGLSLAWSRYPHAALRLSPRLALRLFLPVMARYS